MDFKMVAGGFAALVAVGLMGQPQGDAGDAAHIATFKSTCQRDLGGRGAAAFCRCIAHGIEGRLLNTDEFRLAGGILRAISETHAAQSAFGADPDRSKRLLQSKFDRLSGEFEDRVALHRKQVVLTAVTGEVRPCEREWSQ